VLAVLFFPRTDTYHVSETLRFNLYTSHATTHDAHQLLDSNCHIGYHRRNPVYVERDLQFKLTAHPVCPSQVFVRFTAYVLTPQQVDSMQPRLPGFTRVAFRGCSNFSVYAVTA